MKLVKFSIFIALFMCVNLTSVMAYNLEGTIYGYDGEPLQEAMVRLLNTQRFERAKDFTNRSGEYKIHGISAGTYTMEITKMNMKSVEQTVSVVGNTYMSTTYKDVHLDEIVRFESVSESEMKGLYMMEVNTIPRGAFSKYRKGVKKLKKNDLDGALKQFQKAIKSYKPFSRCYTHIGEIYTKKKNYQQAEEYLRKAISFNSDDPLPMTALGKLFSLQGKWVEAEEILVKVCEIDPARAENHFLYGTTLYELKKQKKAELELTQGLMIQPRQSGDARILLANIFIEQSRLTDAREMLNSYLRENPFAENRKVVKKRLKELEQQISVYNLPPME